MSRFIFVSTPTFELWDWTNPDVKGIGGSETSHIEMARRLAARGHEVISYAPTPFLGPVENEGVTWYRFDQLDYSQTPDVWIVYRAPEVLDNIAEGQTIWHICQDIDYELEGRELTEARAKKITRLVALCEPHAKYLQWRYPETKDRTSVSSNGIKRELIESILQDPPERNPKRMMYASSPDRGMGFLLQIFPRVKERIPDVELHVFYGFDNIEKAVEYYGPNSRVAINTEMLKRLLDQPGVFHHGRTPQPELLREWFKSGIWCHPSNFRETSCITCMDAQACGAIPITSPVWAIAENVKHGVFIHGNLEFELIRARYAMEVIRMVVQPDLQKEIRREMMPWALEHFSWERFVDQWEEWARADVRETVAA